MTNNHPLVCNIFDKLLVRRTRKVLTNYVCSFSGDLLERLFAENFEEFYLR